MINPITPITPIESNAATNILQENTTHYIHFSGKTWCKIAEHSDGSTIKNLRLTSRYIKNSIKPIVESKFKESAASQVYKYERYQELFAPILKNLHKNTKNQIDAYNANNKCNPKFEKDFKYFLFKKLSKE